MAHPESPARDTHLRAPGFRWSLLLLCATLVVMGVLATALLPRPGFPLDDSWIHQSVARNFAHFGSLGYLPHQRSSGSTSLLWTVVLAARFRLIPALGPLPYTLLINGACLFGISFLSMRLALRDRMPFALALMWALAPLANGNFVWLAFTGMEHLLFVFLSLLSILLWAGSSASPVWAGVAFGLLAATRPEGMVLAALCFVVPSFAHRTRRDVLLALGPTILLAAIPFAVNLFTSHSLLPLTFKGRQWLYLGGDQPRLAVRLRLVLAWFHRIVFALRAPDAGATSVATRILNLLGSASLTLLCALGLWSLVRDRCRLTLAVCAWGMLHSALYIVMLPTPGHGGRYQPFLLMLAFPLALRGIYLLLSAVHLAPRLQLLVPAAALVACAFVSLRLWRSTLRSGIQHIESSHGVMSVYLDQHLPHETVAVFDIGRIGYTFTGNIVDLGGLTDPAYVRYLLSGQVPLYLREHGIHWLVLPTDADRNSPLGSDLHLFTNPALRLTPVYRICSPVQVWQLGFLQTNNAYPCQELDRVSFP